MISLLAVSFLAQINFCPSDNVPNTCGKASHGGTSVGDPVDFSQGKATGYVKRTDFSIPTPHGAFEFERTMATVWTPSQLPNTNYADATFFFKVAKPFGEVHFSDGMYWWHSLMPMVLVDVGVAHARLPSGRWVQFASLPASCTTDQVISLGSLQDKERVTLLCSGASTNRSFALIDVDGRRYEFSALNKWEMVRSNGIGVVERYFLSEIRVGTQTLATISYNQPLGVAEATLTKCLGHSGAPSYLPYIRSVSIPSVNRTLDFRYESRGTYTSNPCPLVEIRMRKSLEAVALGKPIARYSFGGTPLLEFRGASTEWGLLPKNGYAWTPARIETYCGYRTDMKVYAGDFGACTGMGASEPENRFRLTATLKNVAESSTPTEHLVVDGGEGQGLNVGFAWDRSSGLGDNSNVTFQQRVTLELTSGFHNGYAKKDFRSCSSPAMSCMGRTTGTDELENRNHGQVGFGFYGEEHRTGVTWQQTGYARQANTGVYLPVVKQQSASMGSWPTATDCSAGALSCSKWQWDSASVSPRLVSEKTPSTYCSASGF